MNHQLHRIVCALLLLPLLSVAAMAQAVSPLEAGQTAVGTVAYRQAQQHTIQLQQGQFARFVIAHPGMNMALRLTDPARKIVGQMQMWSGGTRTQQTTEMLSVIAQHTGAYQLTLTLTEDIKHAMPYQLQLVEVRAAQPDDHARIAAERQLVTGQRLLRAAAATQIQAGRQSLERAVETLRTSNDSFGQSVALATLATAYERLAEHQKSAAACEQALALTRARGDARAEMNVLHQLGVALFQLDAEKAVAVETQALQLAQQLQDRRHEAYSHTKIGVAYQWFETQQVDKAIAHYQQALTIYRSINDRLGEEETLVFLGQTHRITEKHQEAIAYLNQAVEIGTQLNLRPMSSLRELGIEYQMLGQTTKAIAHLKQMLRHSRFHQNVRQEGIALSVLGGVYSNLKQYDKALTIHQQMLLHARASQTKAGEGGEARALMDLSYDYFSLKRYAPSLRLMKRAQRLFQQENRTDFATILLVDIGDAYRELKQPRQAIRYHNQALPALQKFPTMRGQQVGMLHGLMLDWKAARNPGLAIFYGKQAVNLLQDMRRNLQGLDAQTQQTFLQANEEYYRKLSDLLIAQGRLPEAEQVIRMLKEAEYFEYVRGDTDKPSQATLTAEEAALEKRFREIGDKLSNIGNERSALLEKKARTAEEEKQLAQLEDDLNVAAQAFEKFLNSLAHELARHKDGGAQLKSLRDAQGLMEDLRELGKGVVALYTLVGENKYRVILTTADFQRAYEYPIKAADLNRKILTFRQALQNPKLDPLPLAQELYKILVGPVAKDLRGTNAQMLMWSLDGVLRYIPVAALHDGEKYLLERFRNAVFTPVSNARFKDEPSRNWRALGLGVTRSFGEKIPALPGVADEMRGIIREEGSTTGILPGTIKLDEQFTQEAMLTALRQRNPVVHVASHFDFKPGNEADSALLLGDGKFLSLAQIKTLPTLFGGVELLTLSACNTATSGEANGKEVEGFGVLAQQKGAKAVVASLWPVADRSTKNLMQEFYRLREAKANSTKAEAMRQAQIKLLRGELQVVGEALAARDIVHETDKATNLPPYKIDAKAPYAHPYYWAPFILIGNWK
ncbi:MAG: CHAT domain-containing protein [Acidobacteria bacterium]|nr:CHAT domain-containing protein [Acidobacteriota bacterium]